ncbi:Membrane metallo-endopeptidase-like 1, partial [Leptotrombidium deliense]
AIDKDSSQPLKKYIKELGGWPIVDGHKWNESRFDWKQTMIKLMKLGFNHNILFTLYVSPDIKTSEKHIITIDQPSLGTPNRKYLLRGLNDTVVRAYKKVIIESAQSLGVKNRTYLENEANKIIAFEAKLAEYSIPSEKRRNFTELYNKYTIEEMQTLAPSIDFLDIIRAIVSEDIQKDEFVIIKVPKFLTNLESLLLEEDERTIANYMVWRAVFSSIAQLDRKWRNIIENYDRVLSGRTIEKARWDTCIKKLFNYFGTPLSALYVRHTFDEKSREIASQMVTYIKNRFISILETINWMDEKTRKRALDKAKAIRPQIGYSTELLDDNKIGEIYENLTLETNTYYESIQKMRLFFNEMDLKKLREAYLKDE